MFRFYYLTSAYICCAHSGTSTQSFCSIGLGALCSHSWSLCFLRLWACILGRFAPSGFALAFSVAFYVASCFAFAFTFSVASLTCALRFVLAFLVASLPRACTSHLHQHSRFALACAGAQSSIIIIKEKKIACAGNRTSTQSLHQI